MRGAFMRENREIPRSPVPLITGGPLREHQGGTPEMHERGKSDSPIVPAKLPNKAARAAAEAVEGRGLAEGNTDRPTRSGRSAGSGVSSGLDRVRRAVARGHEAADLASPVACRPTRRVLPEVGAQCGSSARWDPCGGPPVRAVPTAITLSG